MAMLLVFCILHPLKLLDLDTFMKYFSLIVLSFLFVLPIGAQYNRQGRSVSITDTYQVITPNANMGLESIYLFENLSQSTLIYQTDKDNVVSFYTYTYSLADKVSYPSVNIQSDGNGNYVLSALNDNEAIVIEDNGLLLCFWILDYSNYKASISAIDVESTDDCNTLKLNLGLSYTPMYYRGVSGLSIEINREFHLTYNTLEWDEDQFVETNKDITLTNPSTEYVLENAPLMTTTFKLSGDQYASNFGDLASFTSSEYEAQTVKGYILATQKNQKTGIYESKEVLGGSAPIDIKFNGVANEPATYFYTWYIYNTEDTDNYIARYSDQDISYTFSQYGTYEVYLELANKSNTCIDTVMVEVQVAESRLDIPNFMTPRDPNGNNKTFKVVYKSIVKYECTIFNRWGNKLFHTTDINQSWDGKYRGQYVEPGPYFYSIIAQGADGAIYKKGGDINVL